VNPPSEPAPDCARCSRLAAFRADNAAAFPDFHNAPVPSFGPLDAPVLIVGLAPGLKGANRTGRPFTGDHAGDLLYPALVDDGLARGAYGRDPSDGLEPTGCRITNAVRCVPPQNRVTGPEAANCRPFLVDEIAAMPRLRVLLALGRVAHEAVLRTFGLRLADHPFAHGARHRLPDGPLLADSFHCSRYNVNTGRLTPAMFAEVLAAVAEDARRPV
jgi:uracil-DNA glycosylase family 4